MSRHDLLAALSLSKVSPDTVLYADLEHDPGESGGWVLRNFSPEPGRVRLPALLPPEAVELPFGLTPQQYFSVVQQLRVQRHFDERVSVLLRRYQRLRERHVAVVAAVQQQAATVEQERDSAVRRWRSDLQQSAREQLPLRIINKSGWDIGELEAELRPRVGYDVQEDPAWLMALLWNDFDTKLDALLWGKGPANDLEELERRMAGAEQWLAEAAPVLEADARDYQQAVREWISHLPEQAGRVRLSALRAREALAGWDFEGGQDFVATLSSGRAHEGDCLCIILKARHLEGLMPRELDMKDDVLMLVWRPGVMTLQNLSPHPATIQGIEFLVNERVAPVAGVEHLQYEPLAPRTGLTLDGWRFRPDTGRQTLSRDEAGQRQMVFGIRVTYRTPADPRPHVLFRTVTHRVVDLAAMQPVR